MPGPLADVIYIHRPIRRDLLEMKADLASLAAGGLNPVAGRFTLLRRMLRIHESGEEEILFPAIDERSPGASDPYRATHDSNRDLMDGLDAALAGDDAPLASDLMSELEDTMSKHLDQEESELIPLCEQHFSVAEQGALSGQMSAHVPPEEMPAATKWMLGLLSREDRAGFVRMVKDAMPAEAFAGFSMGIKAALAADDWSDLVGRVPELGA